VAQPNLFKVVSKRLLKELASLPRAISIMAVITTLSALGTVIPQNKVRENYHHLQQHSSSSSSKGS
jgi:cytochrome c biogenesis protein